MKEKVQERREAYFKAYLCDGALLDGEFGFPILKRTCYMPKNLVSFVESRTKRRLDNKWLHFYAEDFNFDCVWQAPIKYLSLIKRFEGVISPDFSLYGDLPKIYQIWNCFRNRALAYWYQSNGVNVVPSVSWSDKESFRWCFDGLPRGGSVSVSGNGCYYNSYCRRRFIYGFYEMIERLAPKVIIGVGYIPKELKARSDLVILPGYSQQRAVRNG